MTLSTASDLSNEWIAIDFGQNKEVTGTEKDNLLISQVSKLTEKVIALEKELERIKFCQSSITSSDKKWLFISVFLYTTLSKFTSTFWGQLLMT